MPTHGTTQSTEFTGTRPMSGLELQVERQYAQDHLFDRRSCRRRAMDVASSVILSVGGIVLAILLFRKSITW